MLRVASRATALQVAVTERPMVDELLQARLQRCPLLHLQNSLCVVSTDNPVDKMWTEINAKKIPLSPQDCNAVACIAAATSSLAFRRNFAYFASNIWVAMMPFDPLALAADGVRNLGCYHGTALLFHMCHKPSRCASAAQKWLLLSSDTVCVCRGLGCLIPFSFSSHRLLVQALTKV